MTRHFDVEVIPIDQLDLTDCVVKKDEAGRDWAHCVECGASCCLAYYKAEKSVVRILLHTPECFAIEKYLDPLIRKKRQEP